MNETQAQNVYVYFVFGIFVVAVAFSFCCCFINVSVVWKATRCLRSPYSNLNLCLCVFMCVCVLCMLPVWLFGRWRKPERKRHVCFGFQFIITRYFYDHERSLMWCVCCMLCSAQNWQYVRVDLDCLVQLSPHLVKVVFSHFWACASHTHTHTMLCLLLFVFISSSSYSIRQTWHLSASMSNIFHSLMGILFYVLFWENWNERDRSNAGKLGKLFSFLARLNVYRLDVTCWRHALNYLPSGWLCCLSLGAV